MTCILNDEFIHFVEEDIVVRLCHLYHVDMCDTISVISQQTNGC